jgi:RNA polymerase sigma factor (TIGR02999 family)
MSDVTRILCAIEQGDGTAAEQLLPLVYDELRRLARAKMANEASGHSLQPTELVHEAYLRLVDTTHPQAWKHRGHFFSAAPEAVRRILVERARRRSAVKHGGAAVRHSLDESCAAPLKPSEEVIAIHDVLDKLAEADRASSELVKLRYFVGMTMEEAAETLGISVRTAHYVWSYARSWLRRELGEDQSQPSP